MKPSSVKGESDYEDYSSTANLFADERPDETIAAFLIKTMEEAERGGLLVLPEYSNAGGLSHLELELRALPRAKKMLDEAKLPRCSCERRLHCYQCPGRTGWPAKKQHLLIWQNGGSRLCL